MDNILIFATFEKKRMQLLREGFTGQKILVLPRIIVQAMDRDPVCSSLYVTDIGYFPHAERHYVSRSHPIDQYVFIYCIEGRGWYSTGGRKYALRAGQFCILPKDKPHSYGADSAEPWTIYWIHFKGDNAQYYCPDSPAPVTSVFSLNLRAGLFDEIFNTLSSSLAIDSLRYASSMLNLYLGARKYASLHSQASDRGGNEDNAVIKSISYMESNISRTLNHGEISLAANYSPSDFSLIFKKATGHSPITYFNILKIQRACSLLEDPSRKIKQVSFEVGIPDQYYFSRLFSRVMGMSPKEYCRRYLKNTI